MASARVRLGELLVDAQIITREQLQEVLATQRNDSRRLGTLLVESGLVTETQVTQILSQQLSVPWVSLYHIDFSRQLLDLVASELADRYCLVPIFVRRVRGLGETLYVAMDDPSDEAAQREVGEAAGLPVRAMIAPPSDIRAAIRAYYTGKSDFPSLAQALRTLEQPRREVQSQHAFAVKPRVELAPPVREDAPSAAPVVVVAAPKEPARTAPEAAAVKSSVSAPAASAPSTAAERRDSAPHIETREIDPARAKRRIMTLTLLDGTQVKIPAQRDRSKSTRSAAREGDQPTTHDVISALRATAHGADAREILGEDPRWEAMFAALLSLLVKKHLISDWEFVEEYKKY